MLSILSVEPLEGYLLRIGFDNGNTLILNMENKVKTIRFRQLKDSGLFHRANTDGRCIHWNELIEISVAEAFEIAQGQNDNRLRE